jgi:hypothetical protein
MNQWENRLWYHSVLSLFFLRSEQSECLTTRMLQMAAMVFPRL